MALRWMEGFEKSQNNVILSRLYRNVSGSSNGITGLRDGSAVTSDDLHITTPELVSPDENTWVVGFAFRCNQSGGLATSQNAFPFVSLRNASGEQVRIEVVSENSSGPGKQAFRLRVMRGATELARTDQMWSANPAEPQWVYFEWKVTVRTGINGSFSLRWHSRKIKDQTATWDNTTSGINTADQGADGADRVEVSWDTGTDVDQVAFDDIYILDSTGAKNNDFIGEFFVEGLSVQGNGDTVQWDLQGGALSLEDAWNEPSSQSMTEDLKRVSSSTVGEIELATLSNPAKIVNVPITAVSLRVFGQMEATGTRDVQFFYRKTTGTPAQVGGKVLTLNSTSIVGDSETLENDPNTATDWVAADLDGLQVGVELDA